MVNKLKILLLESKYPFFSDEQLQIFLDDNENDIYKYSDIETKLIDSTKKYIKDFYNNNLGVDTLNIKISSLISNNYISEVRDKDGNCTGYVSVYKDDNNVVIYTPYLKCKNYVSNGYVERHDG